MSCLRRSIRGTHVVFAMLVGFLVLSAYALPVAPLFQQGEIEAASVHPKNGATPEWILQLQTRNARQLPVAQTEEPSFWI